MYQWTFDQRFIKYLWVKSNCSVRFSGSYFRVSRS